MALIGCLFGLTSVAAQTGAPELMVPDNDRILAEINDPQSPFYYPNLYTRYMSGDPALTFEDYHHLYYGYVFSPDYGPFDDSFEEANILMIFEKYRGEPDAGAMLDIIYNGLVVMGQDPFSPSNLNFLTFAYGGIGDTLNERAYFERLSKVLEVIGRSGTGLAQESPIHIIRFSHASDWLAAQGLEIANRRVMTRSLEYISLSKRDEGIMGYYFDFSRIYWRKPENGNQGGTGWQINDVPIGKNSKNR